MPLFLQQQNTRTTVLVAECHHCKCRKTFVLDTKAYNRWINGELIQNVFPQLSAENREMMISEICPDCWRKIFA